MTDFNQILIPGDVNNGIVNVVVEIPTGGLEKIEWNREKLAMVVDRLETPDFAMPTSYGFIPQTLNEDNDSLDVLIISDQPISTGTSMPAKFVGVMKFDDEGKSDDKIIVVPIGDEINSISDIPQPKIDQITHYFNHYKDSRKPGTTIVKGWSNNFEAKTIIDQSINRWNNR